MTAPFRFPRFFVTSPAPCPYLPGRSERKVFTELNGANSIELNDALGRIGFRRSQNVAYRPSCQSCTACVSVRVCTQNFAPNASQRRTLRQHSDLVVEARAPWATEEQFDLLTSYLSSRHPEGGMADMTVRDYAMMIEDSHIDTRLIEYRFTGGEHHAIILFQKQMCQLCDGRGLARAVDADHQDDVWAGKR